MRCCANHSATVLGTALLAIFAIMLMTFNTRPASVEANSLDRLRPKTDQAALEREVDFPYYSLREGFDSTLRLVNGSGFPIAFSITVNSLKGESLQSSTLTIGPNDTLALDLRTLIRELNGNTGEDLPKADTLESKTRVTDDFAEGSVSVHYRASPIMALLGQITIANPDLHLSHESYMVQNNLQMSSIPSILNSTWWGLRPGRDANFAISNTSGERTTADIFLDFQGHRHTIRAQVFGPHETKVLSVTKLLGELDLIPSQIPEGGMTIINRGVTPVLIAQGWILDTSTGFSTTLDFPSPQKPNTLYASGVPIGTPSENSPYAEAGNFTPHIIIRNLSDSLQDVAVAVEYPGPKGAEESKLPLLSVPPYSTVDLSVKPASAQLPQSLPYCSFRIQYSGQPGSVVAGLSSVEERSDFVVDSRVVNERVIKRSGANPWHLDTETESVLFLTSTSEKEVGVALQIDAGGVKYHVTDMRLKPHETRAINIRKLRDQQKPDFLSHRIPADAKDGVVFWLDVGEKPVVGRLVVFHRSEGTASNYDCGCQCGDFGPGGGPGGYEFDTYSVTGVPGYSSLAVGATTDLTAVAQYDDCNFNTYYFNVSDSWDASPSSVGAVNGGHVTTQSPGVLTITAHYAHCYWTYDVDLGCQCPFQNVENAPVTINVTPRIDSVSPPRGLIGATTSSVTITGQGFTGGHVNTPWSVQNITTYTDTQIVFDLAIPSSATPGNNAAAISVTAGGQGSNTKDFYVQVPTSLSMVPGTASGTTENLCTSNACGTIVKFYYQVNDQATQPIRASMSMWDQFDTTFNPDNLHMQGTTFLTTCPNNTGPCNVNTKPDGTFLELALGACSTDCYNGACKTGGPSGIGQTWHIASSPIRQSISEYCEKVLVNGVQVK